MIYFSFIGNHDEIRPSSEKGAFRNIFSHHKNEITKVFALITPKTDRADYKKIALENFELIKQENSSTEIFPIEIDLKNPVDYDLVYPQLLDVILNLEEEHKISGEECLINITSGTPTMTTCWILISQSGVLKNAKLLQSFEKKYSKEGSTIREVSFAIDDFPKIEAPSSVKRQLTILSRKNKELEEKIEIDEINKKLPDLIGNSKQILEIKDQIFRDIDSNTHVLIIGERGTGKEVVAKSIWKHHHKDEDDQLLTIDCGTLSENLIQSELFGHKRGAFTGADSDRSGILSTGDGRMIFLDEIGNLPIDGQQKLLRVLTHGEIRKLGSDTIENVDVQIIAATNKNVDDPTLFAADIKDRFDEIITLPPLRERKEDIRIITDYLLNIHSKTHTPLTPLLLSEEIYSKLEQYDFPGNIRELETWIKRMLRRFSSGGLVKLSQLPERFITEIIAEGNEEMFLPELPLKIPFSDYIEQIREKARTMSNGNMSEVDRLLNQSIGTERQRQFQKKK